MGPRPRCTPFVTGHVEPGARVVTDGWTGYHGIDALGYTHEPHSQRAARARGDDPGELLPAVHCVASLAKRWLLGTHQGSVEETHLPRARELAVEFDINRLPVSGHLRRAAVQIRKGGLDDEEMVEVSHLYEAGWSSGRLAERYDVSADTVLKALRSSGVKIRPRRGGPGSRWRSA
jgi:hypothetical protein